MYIIVGGGDRLGYYLLKALLNEGHEVLVLEKDARICKTITDELGSVCFRGGGCEAATLAEGGAGRGGAGGGRGGVCFGGDGCEAATLAEVGAGRADMLVAVTGDDEDNLVSCQVAKHKYNVPRTIARIRNPLNAVLFKKLGIDVTVSSTDIILEAIEREVPTHPVTQLLSLDEKGLVIVDVKISPQSATVGE